MDHPLDVALIIFDADGTLRRCIAHKGPCHNGPHQWELIPGVRDVLACYDWQRMDAGIASNQPGINLGHRTVDTVMGEMRTMIDQSFPRGARVPIHICPHYEAQHCLCRKPCPGLLWFNIADYLIHRKVSLDMRRETILFVGDSEEDEQAAMRAGIRFLSAQHFFGWRTPYNT